MRICVLAPAVLLLSTPSAFGQAAAIRTFVNGVSSENSKQEVHDLHIEYNNVANGAGILSGGVGTPKITFKGKQVDISFSDKLPTADSVTVEASTTAGSMNIEKWWWTDGSGKPVTRSCTIGKKQSEINEYGPTLRGDEPVCDPGKEDVYTIWNKRHHWGGKAREKNKVEITLDIRPFLKKLPPSMKKEDVIKNFQAAIKQWTACTDLTTKGTLPTAGKGDNPANQGDGRDPAVMGPGSTHAGGGKGQKFRSLTERECSAAFFKYPKGLAIRLVTDGTEGEGDITAEWGIPAQYGKAKGVGLPSAPGDPDTTTKGNIYMHPQDKDVKWHLGEDTDGDGFITNKDTDVVGKDELDFYSVLKHEIGHVLCFNHAGENAFHDYRFDTAEPLGGKFPLESGVRSPFPTSVGDDFGDGRESIIFSSDRPGGFGGLDLWMAMPTEVGWRVENLGPGVNSAGDEVDPYLAADGTLLLFSSNRGGTSFDLYQSTLDLTTGKWRPAQPIEAVNTGYDERHPSLTANMRTLYFASNRPGGAGGWDIWASEWIPQVGFSRPYNLGAPINTAANETAPAISGDGALLVFSSDRSGGYGGYDLWCSHLRPTWTDPENLGPSVNSPANESDPILRLDNRSLVFTSDRSGKIGALESSLMSLDRKQSSVALAPIAGAALLLVLGLRVAVRRGSAGAGR
jgi:hypothetical protein